MQTTTDLEAMRELLESMQGQIASLVSQNDALAKQVSDLSEDLRAQAAESDKVIASLKAELAEAKLKEASLVEEIKFWNMRFYGSKSEKVAHGQISLFNEMEAAFDEEHPEPSIEDALPKRKGKPHRRGGKVTIDYDRFKTIVIEHDIPEGERACPECGCVLREMNVEVTKRLKIVPAQIYVEEHRRHVYRCADCCGANARGEERKSVIVRAPQPKPPIPGSFATPSLISYVINGKYSLGLPLYRMEAEFRSMRAEIEAGHGQLGHKRARQVAVEGPLAHKGGAAVARPDARRRDDGPGPQGAEPQADPQVEDVAVLLGQTRHPGIRIRVPRDARQVGRRGLPARLEGHAHHRRLPPLLQPPGGRRHQHRVPGARPPKVRRDRQGRRRRRQGGQVPVPQRRARRAQDDRRDVQGRQGLRQARREGAQGEEDRGAPAPHAQLLRLLRAERGGRDAEEQAGQGPALRHLELALRHERARRRPPGARQQHRGAGHEGLRDRPQGVAVQRHAQGS